MTTIVERGLSQHFFQFKYFNYVLDLKYNRTYQPKKEDIKDKNWFWLSWLLKIET